jgi:hypothetical protein
VSINESVNESCAQVYRSVFNSYTRRMVAAVQHQQHMGTILRENDLFQESMFRKQHTDGLCAGHQLEKP